MALFTRPKPVVASVAPYSSSVRAVRAAAERIEPDAERGKARARRAEKWQERAWELYSEVGECRQAARLFGDAFARCNWFVGVRPDPESDPVPVTDENATELGVSVAEGDAAQKALARLRSPRGGQTELRRNLGVQLFIPGECYLVGREDVDGERWDVLSTSELEVDSANGGYRIKSGPGADSMPVESGSAQVTRIYRPHPQYGGWPDSPMRSAITILDEYLDLTLAIRAAARSRAAGPGVWVLPNSMRNGPAGGETAGQGDGQAVSNDAVVTDLVTATGAAIADVSSPFARVPVMLFVNDDLWREGNWQNSLVTWDREVDRVAAEQRAELIKRFAVTIDLPAEVLTGIADMNHWGAWQVPESAFRDHIAPALILGCDGITLGYLRPALRLAGLADPDRWEVWFDPAPLLTNVNQAEEYREAYDRMEVSGDALRRVSSIPDEDKPDDEEIARRIEIAQATRRVRSDSSTEGGPPPADRPAPSAPAAISTPVALTAGGGPVDAGLLALPGALARMDDGLLADLHAAADAAMRRALEKANARLKALAKRDPAARAAVRDVEPSSLMVAPTLGPGILAALIDENDGDLFGGAWGPLIDRFQRRTSRATAEAIRLAAANGDLSDLDAEAMLARLDDDRTEAAALFLAGLTALATGLLARPEPLGPPGETDGALVPPNVTRQALIRAGGGGGEATSLLTALDIHELFRRSGIALDGRVWVYGDPAARETVFQPHYDLQASYGPGTDGFADDFSDLPGSGGAWPFVDHYRPSDHRGCLCSTPYRQAVRVPSSTQEAAA